MADAVLKEGWTVKRSRYLKKWKARWTILYSNHLVTLKKQNSTAVTERIPMTETYRVSKVEGLNRPFVFQLDTNNRSYLLSVTQNWERDQWVEVLERTIRRYNPTTNWRLERDKLRKMAEDIIQELPQENSREKTFLT
jgi:hypothetical protein